MKYQKYQKKMRMVHMMFVQCDTVFRADARVICIYFKRKYDQKVKKNNKKMIIPVRVQPIGHWEDGHMSNF